MPLHVRELPPALHDLFTATAADRARAAGFPRRARALTGPVFAQAVVFTLLENPRATPDDCADTAARRGAPVSPQAFDRRFTRAAAGFLGTLLVEAFDRSFNSLRPALLPLCRRFTGVDLRDAPPVTLPAALADGFPGRGGVHPPHGRAAACKLVLEAEVTTGALTELSVLTGLADDRTAAVSHQPLPAGAVLLEDMGFLSGDRLQGYIAQGVYVITRIPAWTAVFDPAGRRLDLAAELSRVAGGRYERAVHIVTADRVPVRLPAARRPDPVVETRRRRLRRDARKRGRAVSAKALAVCGWNILATTAPAALVSAAAAAVRRRVRWQIELVFQVFKSEGQIGRTRSQKPWRALAELYAKLLGMVVQQWALLAAGYVMVKHSARRAARRVRRAARRVRRAAAELLAGVRSLPRLAWAVVRLAGERHRHGRVARRTTDPSTLDRRTALDPRFDQPPAVDAR